MKIAHKPMKTRRDFLKVLSGCAASMALGPMIPHGSVHAGESRAQGDSPNVLMIVLDDLNDWIGCLGGHPDVKTPNFDRLAQRGVLFTNAHCSAPLCNPSRVSFFTGIAPSTSGVYSNETSLRSALPNAVTMQEHFVAHGYRSMGTGKIFHAELQDPQSWNEYYPSMSVNKPDSPRPPYRPLCHMPDAGPYHDWGPMDLSGGETREAAIAQWAVDELAKAHDKPFFLAVGLTQTHCPYYVPRKYLDMYPAESITLPVINEADLDDVPPAGVVFATLNDPFLSIREHGQWRNAVAAYLAAVTFADELIGQVLDSLDQSRYAGNTIIVVWGDNGLHFGEKLHWDKQSLWEESLHCPLIIAGPGVASRGGRCNKAVSMINVYPTLIDLCGLTPRTDLDGISLRPLLSDPYAEWNHPAVSTFPYNTHSVRSDRYRYIRYNDGTEELYDHGTDDLEWNNLAADPQYAGIKSELASWLPKINKPPV